jgi:hypothetical protein
MSRKGRRHHRPKTPPTIDDVKGPKPKPPSYTPIVAKTGRRQSRIGFADYTEPSEQIEARKRESACVELRTLGASFDEIAAEVGYASKGAAFDAYTRGFKAAVGEIQAESVEALKSQLIRNRAYRKRVITAGNENGGAGAIAAVATALKVDQFDAALRGIRPGDGANIDAVPTIAGPGGTNGAVMCAKCGGAAAALPDPKFELERIKQINAVLIESNVHLVPLKVDDSGWVEQSAPDTQPEPQTASPKVTVTQNSNARFERIRDRELRDLTDIDFPSNEIL